MNEMGKKGMRSQVPRGRCDGMQQQRHPSLWLRLGLARVGSLLEVGQLENTALALLEIGTYGMAFPWGQKQGQAWLCGLRLVPVRCGWGAIQPVQCLVPEGGNFAYFFHCG